MISSNQYYVVSLKTKCDDKHQSTHHLTSNYLNSLNKIISLKGNIDINELSPNINLFNK